MTSTRRRARVLALLAGAAAVASPAPAIADGDPGRVLLPAAGDRLSGAFARMGPALALRGAQIDHDHALATLCAADGGRCFHLRLDDPKRSCAGPTATLAGPWCATFPDGAVNPAQLAAIVGALSSDAEDAIWSKPLDAPGFQLDASPPSGAGRRWAGVRVASLALGALLAPAAIGLLVGHAARRLRRRRWRGASAGLLLVLAPIAAALALAPRLLLVGIWDALLIALAAGVGILVGAHEIGRPGGPIDRRGLVVAAVSTLLAIGLLEIGARALLPLPPAFPPSEKASLLLPDLPEGRYLYSTDDYKESVCKAVYRERYPHPGSAERVGVLLPEAFLAGPHDGGRVVLHLGDSMTFGVGVPHEQAFPSLLGRLDPEVRHLNGAIPSVGADVYLLLARSWSERVRLDGVVIHLFTGNDLEDTDHPYPCCDYRPLLAYGDGAPALACPEPSLVERSFAASSRWLLAHSPPPYALRVATGFSSAARHACAAFLRLRDRIGPARTDERAYSHIHDILRAARDELAARHVPLLVVVLPYQRALEAAEPKRHPAYEIRRRMLAIAAELAIPALDPWDLFEDAVRREGAGRWFRNEVEHDVHFSAAGHALLAGWLSERLPDLP